MKNILRNILTCALLLICSNAIAEKKNLDQCRAIQVELNRLESLRKVGGSAKEMDNWKRRMHKKQDQYSKLYCRQYRFLSD